MRFLYFSLFSADRFDVSAPASINSCTDSVWPFHAAQINAVLPSPFCASRSAPAAINSFTDSVWPFHAAQINAVLPSPFCASRSAPASINSFTDSVWPFHTAQINAVLPSPFCASRSAPASINSFKGFVPPLDAAQINAVQPSLSGMLRFGFFFSTDVNCVILFFLTAFMMAYFEVKKGIIDSSILLSVYQASYSWLCTLYLTAAF